MEVFTPFFGAHSRVDLVADRAGDLLRIQCKTARIMNGALWFRSCSNTANIPVDDRGEIDAFGVYSPTLDRVYLVPVGHASIRGCSLRLEPARNNQQTGIRWATDYLIGPP
jgi:hypothetical protein